MYIFFSEKSSHLKQAKNLRQAGKWLTVCLFNILHVFCHPLIYFFQNQFFYKYSFRNIEQLEFRRGPTF